jgi:hypothetical protein
VCVCFLSCLFVHLSLLISLVFLFVCFCFGGFTIVS